MNLKYLRVFVVFFPSIIIVKITNPKIIITPMTTVPVEVSQKQGEFNSCLSKHLVKRVSTFIFPQSCLQLKEFSPPEHILSPQISAVAFPSTVTAENKKLDQKHLVELSLSKQYAQMLFINSSRLNLFRK